MTTINFSKSDLCRSINAATAAARNNKKQLDRIEKAALWISQFPGASFTLHTDTIRIKSSRSDTVYTLTLGQDCMEHSCAATKPCWHLTLGSIIMAANTIRQRRESLPYPELAIYDIDFTVDNINAITDAANLVLFGAV